MKAERPLYRDPNLQAVFSVTLVAIMGVSAITPAFPRIVDQLGSTPQEVGLLITFFTLPGVVLTPLLGVLADRFGRKRILVPSLIVFGVAGAACALVRNMDLLLTLRFVQGVGAASLGSLNVTVIGDLYDGRARTAAMGYNASVLSVGTATYPLIGGALATIAWYFPFALAALAIPVALIVVLVLDNPEPVSAQSLGSYLLGAWKSVRNRQVLGLFAASILTFMILYGAYLAYFPILVDERFAGSPLVIGVLMACASLATAVTSSQLGRLAAVFSERQLLLSAFVLYMISMTTIPIVPSLWLLVLPALLFGVGQGLNVPNIMTLLAALAPMEQRAAVMSLNGMVLRMGQTLGPLSIGLVYGLGGLNAAFLAGTFLAIALFVVVAWLVRSPA